MDLSDGCMGLRSRLTVLQIFQLLLQIADLLLDVSDLCVIIGTLLVIGGNRLFDSALLLGGGGLLDSGLQSNINELDLGFGVVDTDGYKVAGYFAICNAMAEDSDEELLVAIVDALGQAIGLPAALTDIPSAIRVV